MITETELTKRAGCHRSSLRRFRSTKLTEGLHWLRKGRSVHYTQEGVDQAIEWARGVNEEKPAATGIITRVYPNPNLIRVEIDGQVANVRVRRGRWPIGRTLSPLISQGPNLYYYTGPPPR